MARFRLGGKPQTQEKDESNDLSKRLVTLLDTANPASEAYRTLRTNLLYSFVDNPPKTIVLTSPSQGEGKSTTCVNLGVVLAQADKDALIIDCDFRRPVVHQFFGLRNLHGVIDVLVGERKLQEVLQEPVEGLKVISTGSIPPNPTEILSSQRFSTFLAAMRERFDYVLVDAPPVLPVSDPAIIATQGDGVLLVMDAQNTRKAAVRQATRNLQAVGATILGTVMNNLKASAGGYYYQSDYSQK